MLKKRYFLTLTALSSTFIGIATSSVLAVEADSSDETCIAGSDKTCLSMKDITGGLELSTPSNPLLSLAGLSPDSVVVPKTGKEFAVAISPIATNVFGSDAYALSLQFNPGLYTMPDNVVIRPGSDGNSDIWETTKGKNINFRRYLTGLNFGLASSRTTGDNAFEQTGFGVSYVYDKKTPFFNNRYFRGCYLKDEVSQWREDAQKDFETKFHELKNKYDLSASDGDRLYSLIYSYSREEKNNYNFPPKTAFSELKLNVDSPDRLYEELQQAFNISNTRTDKDGNRIYVAQSSDEIQDQCRKKATAWNRDVYGIGVAGYWTDYEDGSDVNGSGLWFSIAKQSGSKGQFILGGSIVDDMAQSRKIDGKEVAKSYDGWQLGARYTYQFGDITDQELKKLEQPKAIRGFVEAGYYEEEFADLEDKYWKLGIGADIKVADETFVQFIIGRAIGSEADQAGYLSANIKWSFSSRPAQ